jgi:hypothetical protein
MPGQIHRCNIYVEADDYTTPVATNIKCRFTHNTLNTQLQSLPTRERTQQLAGRRLQYPTDFNMPDNARVEWIGDPTGNDSGNTLWTVVESTESMWHGPNGRPVVQTCQLERVDAVG